jgi:hypothetical protein
MFLRAVSLGSISSRATRAAAAGGGACALVGALVVIAAAGALTLLGGIAPHATLRRAGVG